MDNKLFWLKLQHLPGGFEGNKKNPINPLKGG
jgi:hypothetical protein